MTWQLIRGPLELAGVVGEESPGDLFHGERRRDHCKMSHAQPRGKQKCYSYRLFGTNSLKEGALRYVNLVLGNDC
jgi:hypothetical protein